MYKYYRECIDCCSKVIKRYENFEIEINYGIYFNFLLNLYIALYYFDKNESKELVLKIKNLIEINPYIKKIYSLNQDFYESQFECAFFE
jgi:hypothetical protein